MNTKRMIMICAVITVSAAFAVPTWTGSIDSTWSASGNWTSGSKPSNGQSAIIQAPRTDMTVSVDETVPTLEWLQVGTADSSVGMDNVTFMGQPLTMHYISLYVSAVFENEILLTNKGNEYIWTLNSGKPSVFNSQVTALGDTLRFLGSSSLTFNGPIVGTLAKLTLDANGGGGNVRTTFNDTVAVNEIDETGCFWTGGIYFNKSGNHWNSLKLGRNPVVCGAVGALPEEGVLQWLGAYSTSCDLGGMNQTLNRLVSDNVGAASCAFVKSTGGEATLTLMPTESATAYCCFQDGVSLYINAKVSESVQTLLNRTHTMTGSITVANGTLEIGGTSVFSAVPRLSIEGGILKCSSSTKAFPAVRTITIGQNASIDLSSASTVPFDTLESLAFTTTSKIYLPSGKIIIVRSCTVDGETLVPDTFYVNPSVIVGGGSIYIERVSKPSTFATWTGGGGQDTSTETAENWGGIVPDLIGYTLEATFGTGGNCATLPLGANYFWQGIKFEGRPDFVLEAESNASVHLYEGGISVADYQTNTIAAPIVVSAPQLWRIGAGSQLDVRSGVLSGPTAPVVSVCGSGNVHLHGENDFAGGLVVTGGTVYVMGETNCLGKASDIGRVRLVQGALREYRMVIPGNAVIEREMYVEADNRTGALLVNGDDSLVRFTKMFTVTGHPRFYFEKGAEVRFEGGYSVPDDWSCLEGSATVVFTNVPASINHLYMGGPIYRFHVASNAINRLEAHAGCVHFATDNALINTTGLIVYPETNGTFLDLHGHDAAFGQVTLYGSPNRAILRSSDAPATISISPTANVTNMGMTCAGQLSFCKRGVYEYICKGGVNTSTGSIDVVEGTFGLFDDATWPNCTGISVSSDARLVIGTQSRAFNRYTTHVSIATGGVIELKAGVVQYVSELTVGGVHMPSGIYGSSESQAAPDNRLGCFAGTGILKVGQYGTKVSFR